MAKSSYFHFTIGPVQGFVAQARRTRDYWAGSFILSWLSGVAMLATQKQSAMIKFPKADRNYLQWLEKGKGEGPAPRQGSIPNRFKAEMNEDSFDPAYVVNAVQDAWKALAGQIFANDLETCIGKHDKTKEIWQNQVNNFWEISWVITDYETDSAALDRRKNWRSHRPPEQGGIKCMMMEGWRELSGVSTPHAESIHKFWNTVRNNKRTGMETDLNKGEALCSIAFIKRRFVHSFEDLTATIKISGKSGETWSPHGWKIKPGIPSVSYMAAVPWLEKVLKKTEEDNELKKKYSDFFNKARKLNSPLIDQSHNIRCIHNLLEKNPALKEWARLDGNMFFPALLENPKQYTDQGKARSVSKAFNKVVSAAGETISPFYSILMMDGDSLGKQMSDEKKQGIISSALQRFTKDVPETVQKNDGFLIYAGGDDVLAVLPLEKALDCAVCLRKLYNDCFTEENRRAVEQNQKTVQTSLSGAIEYAHIKMPLTKVLRDAHVLLDDIAKDRTGRDALAIRVWKPGGTALEWTQPWNIVLKDAENSTKLQDLVEIFRACNKEDPQFSNNFFFTIRERFQILNPPQEPGKIGCTSDQEGDDQQKKINPLSSEQRIRLMAMEFMNSGANRETGTGEDEKKNSLTMTDAIKIIKPLIEQCTPHYRVTNSENDNEEHEIKATEFLEADGAMLIRFLTQKGVR